MNALGRHEEAFAAFREELTLNPGHAEARRDYEVLVEALRRKQILKPNPEQRPYHTELPLGVLRSLQAAGHNYAYRGVPMIKNPFDFALYPLVFWNVKPKTVIEIGSKDGGSALWFGDMMDNFGVDGHVYSLDVVKVTNVEHKRVTFMEADGRALGRTFTPDFLSSLPRPWLIIEDADHTYETSIAVLKFFHSWLQPGEYIIIEDGIISDLEQDKNCNSGPHRALKEFLNNCAGEYDIDSQYADFFGYNFTWCTNGFLQKKKYALNPQLPRDIVREFNSDDPAPLGAESQMSQNERFQLYLAARTIKACGPKLRFIEIGSYAGASLKLLSNALQRLGVPVEGFAVEPGGKPQLYDILKQLSGRVEHLKMLSPQAAPILKATFGRDGILPQFIFIDGNHTYEGVRQDILDYYPLLAPGGLMVFHDYLPPLNDANRAAIMFHHANTEPGIRRACQEVIEGKFGAEPMELPLLYPNDPTQTQAHLPVIPGVFSTLRVYRKR